MKTIETFENDLRLAEIELAKVADELRDIDTEIYNLTDAIFIDEDAMSGEIVKEMDKINELITDQPFMIERSADQFIAEIDDKAMNIVSLLSETKLKRKELADLCYKRRRYADCYNELKNKFIEKIKDFINEDEDEE